MFEGALPTRWVRIARLEVLQLGIDTASCCRIKARLLLIREGLRQHPTSQAYYRRLGSSQILGRILDVIARSFQSQKWPLGNGKARDNDEVVKKEDRKVERDGKK